MPPASPPPLAPASHLRRHQTQGHRQDPRQGPSGRAAVALIHWGAWGDLYVAAAALREVADAFPHAPLYVVGTDKWLQILDPEAWPTLAGIVASDRGRRGDLYLWNGAQGAWALAQPALSLVSFFCSARATFNLRTESLRFAWAPFLAGVPRRHGSAPGPLARLLYTHRAKWLGKDPLIHERDRMLQVIEAPSRASALARKWREGPGLPRLKEPDRVTAERLAQAEFGHYWLINPTASRREKAWPVEKFRELSRRLVPLLAGAGLELRILGAPSESEWLRQAVPPGLDPGRAIVQPPSARHLLDVLGGARALVTNTSSTQFLAPGLGVRTLTLMGRSRPEIWGPLGPRDLVVRGAIDPALDKEIFRQEELAYQSIPVASVLAACEEMLR